MDAQDENGFQLTEEKAGLSFPRNESSNASSILIIYILTYNGIALDWIQLVKRRRPNSIASQSFCMPRKE